MFQLRSVDILTCFIGLLHRRHFELGLRAVTNVKLDMWAAGWTYVTCLKLLVSPSWGGPHITRLSDADISTESDQGPRPDFSCRTCVVWLYLKQNRAVSNNMLTAVLFLHGQLKMSAVKKVEEIIILKTHFRKRKGSTKSKKFSPARLTSNSLCREFTVSDIFSSNFSSKFTTFPLRLCLFCHLFLFWERKVQKLCVLVGFRGCLVMQLAVFSSIFTPDVCFDAKTQKWVSHAVGV